MPTEPTTPSGVSPTSPTVQHFLSATRREEWLSVPELVHALSMAGYWPSGIQATADAREAHVREQLATLRDDAGALLFASLDIYREGTLTTVYKQVRLLRRRPR